MMESSTLSVVHEAQHGEVGTMGWMECSVKPLVSVDMAELVSMVERPCEVELDMEVLVEVMLVERVETEGWSGVPVNWIEADLWTDSSNKVPAEAC